MPFREKVTELGEKGLQIIEEYFDGKRHGTDLVREASKMVSQAVKIEHMNQIQKNADRSFAIRLLPFLPKDKEIREKYIEMTNPQIKGLLETRPQK
jgi:hypothetical protein